MNEYKKDRPTSEQLVDLLDNELDITICSDVVHGLDFEYKQLQQENEQLKEDIKNIIKILNKNCDDLEATEEEFESLGRWQNE